MKQDEYSTARPGSSLKTGPLSFLDQNGIEMALKFIPKVCIIFYNQGSHRLWKTWKMAEKKIHAWKNHGI